MDTLVQEPDATQETRFLPALAEAIAEWWPELRGRSFAVADATITKENTPKLPLCMVAFDRGTGDQITVSSNSSFTLVDMILIEFWMDPVRIKNPNGSETPFWTYYPYEPIRDALLTNLSNWDAPNCARLAYRGLNIVADTQAVTLTFSFMATYEWNATVLDRGEPFKISFNLCPPPACIPDDDCEDVSDECHPCP